MKLDAKALGKIIGMVVREELKRQLPGLIEKHLTERYIRKVVAERSNLADHLSGEEDEVPEPLVNDHEGIYNRNPLVKGGEPDEEEDEHPIRKRSNEVVSKLMGQNNPMAFLYEGVEPLSKDPTAGLPNKGRGVPIEKMGLDAEKMRQLAGMESRPQRQQQEEVEAPARKFDPKLDTPIGAQPQQQQQRPQPRMMPRMSSNPFLDESAAFPDKPIVLDD